MAKDSPAATELRSLDGYVELYAERLADAPALVYEDGRPLTYSALAVEVERYARAFAGHGIGRGDVVAVLGFSRPECFVAFLALCRIGAIFLGLNPKHTARELAFVIDDSKPRTLLAMHSRDDTPAGLEVVTRGPALDAYLSAAGEYATASDPTAPCAIVYTSGSTGVPKGALLSQSGMIHSALISWEHWYGALRPQRTLAQHPINHVGWLVCECVTTFVAGGTLFFRERFNAEATLRLIESERLNLWLAFPSMLILAKETPDFARCDLSSLETIALGMPGSVELMRTYQERSGAVMCISYGLTEANGGAITVTARDASLEAVATTIGRPVPGAEVSVLGLDGEPASDGTEGELLVRDPSLFLGYLNRPDATAEALDRDGWLHTGDVVRRLPTGEFQMVGRKKEMFKSGGYNVYPTEIEAIIGSHPAVAAVAVVEVPDRLWDEVGVAYVVPRDGVSLEVEQIRAYARERLANYKVPKRFVVAAELPQLPNGKFDKVTLRAQAKELKAS